MNELDIVNKLDRFDQLIHQQAFNDADAYHKAKKLSLEILEYLPKCHFLGWEIYHKYSEKISSLNERIIKKAAPFVKFKLPEIFQEFQKFDKLLYTVNCKPQERAFTELFLEPMINGICEEIENSQDTSQGIVYRVTNAQGVQHFLVGTCHTSTENMTKAPLLKHALAKSEELHLESNSPILWNLYKIRQLNLPNPYRYSVDYTLRNSAIEQNKPVHGLEKIVWENIIHLNQ